MADAFRFSQYMVDPGAKLSLRPVGLPKPVVPVNVALSPPEPQKEDPPYTLIAAGVVALAVVGLVVYKKKFAKRR